MFVNLKRVGNKWVNEKIEDVEDIVKKFIYGKMILVCYWYLENSFYYKRWYVLLFCGYVYVIINLFIEWFLIRSIIIIGNCLDIFDGFI